MSLDLLVKSSGFNREGPARGRACFVDLSLSGVSRFWGPGDRRDGGRDAMLRDAADQQVFGTFLASKADYLITGDRDLLALAEKYPIVTPAAFWERPGL